MFRSGEIQPGSGLRFVFQRDEFGRTLSSRRVDDSGTRQQGDHPGSPHHNPGNHFFEFASCSGVSARGPSAISRGLFGSAEGSVQQSGTPSERVQNGCGSGGFNFGWQRRSPLTGLTTTQTWPLAADADLSSGSAGPHPGGSSVETSSRGTRTRRMPQFARQR